MATGPVVLLRRQESWVAGVARYYAALLPSQEHKPAGYGTPKTIAPAPDQTVRADS